MSDNTSETQSEAATCSTAAPDFAGAPSSPKPHMARISEPTWGNNPPFPQMSNRASDEFSSSGTDGTLSPAAADRVFPVRSVVAVAPPGHDTADSYFQGIGSRRRSVDQTSARAPTQPSTPQPQDTEPSSRRWSIPEEVIPNQSDGNDSTDAGLRRTKVSEDRDPIASPAKAPDAPHLSSASARPTLTRCETSTSADDFGPLMTARFQHVVTEGGHAIITGRGGDVLQRCEDEPISIPGAVQGFGLLIVLEEDKDARLVVRIVSENCKRIIGYTARELFALATFTDALTEDQGDNLLDHIDFIRDESTDVTVNGPEVFTMSIRNPLTRRNTKMWCAIHINDTQPHLIICEFELEDDTLYPPIPSNSTTPEPPEDTLQSQPTEEELAESTQNNSKPLRVLRSARKRKGEAAAMEVFNIMSQVQEQLAAAPNLDQFLKVLVGVVKELTGFHRVMVYQFDAAWNGRVVTELVDPRATKDLYKGLNFPASDIPKQARDLYKINKVRMLYDRDQETARLVCRSIEDLENPLDLTHSYLRAMSPIHLKYLANMAVRSSMSISINAFGELWGLIACHTYGAKGMRVAFPIRKMCRLVGDSASRNIERLSYASRLQARKLINTASTQANPSGYIVATSEDLLKLFDANFGILSVRDETKTMGDLEHSQEPLALLEYFRMRCVTNVTTSQNIQLDFPDLQYPPGFSLIAGVLVVPLSAGGRDFIIFFRKGQMKEVKWAGNPYEKYIKQGTEGYLEPRKSFRTWTENVLGKCREWTEEEIETAAVLCLVYGKFIQVWREKEAAIQTSQLTRLLLANSAHEVRTPLNAIINYLEIALEGPLDNETRENLSKSHSASKSLIYVINDLLDLTKTVEGGELIKDEPFDLAATLREATEPFNGDARRKNLTYEVKDHAKLPCHVLGDQGRVRQAISNITANAFQNTSQGSITVDMLCASQADGNVDIEIVVTDTGAGMNSRKLDSIFRELEQVSTADDDESGEQQSQLVPSEGSKKDSKSLGLGLAVVARVVKNMGGQLRLKSEEGKGSRFVLYLPFMLAESTEEQANIEQALSYGSVTPQAEHAYSPTTNTPPPQANEMTLVDSTSPTRRGNSQRRRPSRKNSADSIGSRQSIRSILSRGSGASGNSSTRSQADRLIEAISEPNQVEGRSRQSSLSRGGHRLPASRPKLGSRNTTSELGDTPGTVSSPSRDTAESNIQAVRVSGGAWPAGSIRVQDSATPLSALRVSEFDSVTPEERPRQQNAHLSDRTLPQASNPVSTGKKTASFDCMRVLVAEDDLVNSRIIKKRLEKLGHEVHLTGNGEECADMYCGKAASFDIVLMDMQMPIVDGLTSTKMIRSYEKLTPDHGLSSRAALNGRVPVIAVSASLVERDRQTYVDAGFDGWILKPILFDRLSSIMRSLVDKELRTENLYKPGGWERGGWFETAQRPAFMVDTSPNEGPPQIMPSEGLAQAAASDDAMVKEEDTSKQTQEQTRLAEAQERRA